MAYRRRSRRAPARRRYRRAAPRRTYRRRVTRRAPMRRRRPHRMSRYVTRSRTRRGRLMGSRSVTTTRAVQASTMKNGDICIEHMEYLGDLIAGANGVFTAQTYAINPGLAQVFPFISGIACQYELYDPTYMSIILKSTSFNSAYNSAGNQNSGSMGITTLYNVYTPTGSINNKVIAEGYEYSTSGNPAKSQISRINVKHNRNPLDTYYVRSGAPPTGQGLNLCDVCNVVVWSSGTQCTSTQAIAEIWCKYRIVFRSPRPYSGQLAFNNLTAKYSYSSTLSGTGPATGNWWGGSGSASATTWSGPGSVTAFAANSNNSLTLLFSSYSNASAFQFPAGIISGNYLVVYVVKGTATGASGSPVVVTPTNCSACSIWNNGTGGFAFNGLYTADTPAVMCIAYSVTITSSPASISFSNGLAFPTTITGADLFVCQFNGLITTAT